ncbi:hypothetical protein [Maribacter sp. 2307UL18-2]|uniref:hypothetical protein n=1 Tax=Maribacter sp. 2307UL18-2 TaxID=3386274 RepID=UPI0039BD4AD0
MTVKNTFQKAVAFFGQSPKQPKVKAQKTLILRGKIVKRATGSKIRLVNPEARILAIEHQKKLRENAINALAMNLPTETEKEQEKIGTIKNAVKSLTANLPKESDLGLNPNWNASVLLSHIGDAAHRSSLESDVVWGRDGEGLLILEIEAQTIKITPEYFELFDKAAERLFNWSGMGKSLNDSEGTEPDTNAFLWNLGDSGARYSNEQKKLKSSDWYLDKLVEKASTATLVYEKATAKKADILEALALATAKEGIRLGFTRDKDKNVLIECSDNRFGCTELSTKVLLPFLQQIIDESSVAGRLTAKKDVSDLLTGFTNLLTL